MNKVQDPKTHRRFSAEELAWLAEHGSEWRQSVSEGRIRYQVLCTGLAVGLAVHIAGYLLKSSASGEPVAVLADLLYTLGYALWTGVVVVALVEIIPALKERQVGRYLDAYEEAIRSRTGGDQSPPTADHHE